MAPKPATDHEIAVCDIGRRHRARLTVAYRGTEFRGFAANEGVRTVAGELATAIATIVRHPVEIACAGRTDAGVHGWGQVITIDLDSSSVSDDSIDLDDLARRVNKLCRPDVSVRDPMWVADDFDVRRAATARTYRYHVWNDPVPNPLIADTVWQLPQPLDLDAMNRAAAALTGEHDFASFCRRPSPAEGVEEPSLVRIMYELIWQRIDDSPLLRFTVTGSAFCHQQVRSMVGTCVDVGLGRIDAEALPAILAAKDRNAAGQVAPPQGLILWHVDYTGTRWDAPARR